MIQETACTTEDFEGLRQWWEEPVTYSGKRFSKNDSNTVKISHSNSIPQSRYDIRKRKLQDIASFTWEMLLSNKEIKKRARLIVMADKADLQCSKAAEKFLMFKFDEEQYKDYLKYAENCWRFTNDLQAKLLCDVCDPKAQQNMDFTKGFIYFNSTAKAFFENACINMVKMNALKIFPYLEALEPLVRCNLDGRMSTKDKLRLRKSDRIFIEPGLESEFLAEGIDEEAFRLSQSFGEELNLNTEGDPRFVTFLFRNLREFLDQNVEGQKELVSETVSRAARQVPTAQSNAAFGTIKSQNSKNQRLLEETDEIKNEKLMGKKFSKLYNKSKVDSEKFIDTLDQRILYLKQTRRLSDKHIANFIDYTKKKFKQKVTDVNLDELPSYSSKVKHQNNDKYVTKERVLFKTNELQEAFSNTYYHETDPFFTSKDHSFHESLDMIDKNCNGSNEMKITKHDFIPTSQHSARRLHGAHKDSHRRDHSPQYIYKMMQSDSKILKSAYPVMPRDFDVIAEGKDAIQDYQQTRGLKQEIQNGRRLAAKKLSKKSDMQVRIGAIINNLQDEWNNGDMEGFKLAYKEKDFVKNVMKNIKCLDVTKTNKKTNPDILWMEKDADCLDFEDKKYKSMVDYFESKIKFPSLPDTYSKDDDYEDILEDKVITHLDNVKDNITKEGVYKKKDKKEAKRTMMRGRRLSKANKTPEMPKDKSWKESDEDPFAVKLFEKTNISARSLKVSKDTKSAATATTANSSVTKNQTKVETPKVKTTTASRSLEKESLEDQAKKTKVNDLFHHNVSSTAQQMNEILMNPENKKLAFKKGYKKPKVIRDSMVYLLNNSLKYDLLNGIGKTGFKKIEFSEAETLNGMGIFKRLDEAIKLHTNWNPVLKNGASIMSYAKFWGAALMLLCIYF